jgi:hypothetical protein
MAARHCEHGREKRNCVTCDGGNICIHKRQRQTCIPCNGSSTCIHQRQRLCCKECQNPLDITISRMVRSSRSSDRAKNRYDANNHIDTCFISGLFEDFECCYWSDCKVVMQHKEYRDDLATIERIDNSIGHIKSNCVLACLNCNLSRKSNR